MPRCPYIYCRTEFETAGDCPRCGHPADPRQLLDPARLLGAEVAGLPERILDLHQILPARDGMVELQLAAMERFGIEKALMQSAPDEAASLVGNAGLSELAAAHPKRFWVSHYIDPRMPEAVERASRAAAAGVRVIKLLPPAGFRLDDPAHEDFLGTLSDLGLVAMVHTGFITARHKEEEARAGAFLSSRYADPLTLDRPARRFPELTFILCHLGGAIWSDAGAQMVTQHDNVWGDVSGFGLFSLQRLLGNRAVVDWGKVFWGNDSPAFAYPMNLRLVLRTLEDAGAERLAQGLLHDNGHRFAESALG